MTFEKVQAVRDVAFVLWKRRHELKRATEELVLEERITEASGERRWEEVASVYSTRESPRGGAFIFDFTGPDGARKLVYVQGMEVVDEKAIAIDQMIHTTMRLTDAREEVRRRAHDNVPVKRPRTPTTGETAVLDVFLVFIVLRCAAAKKAKKEDAREVEIKVPATCTIQASAENDEGGNRPRGGGEDGGRTF